MQLAAIVEADYITVPGGRRRGRRHHQRRTAAQAIAQLETQMREAAKKFEFERAAALRDRIRSLKQRDLGVIAATRLSRLLLRSAGVTQAVLKVPVVGARHAVPGADAWQPRAIPLMFS